MIKSKKIKYFFYVFALLLIVRIAYKYSPRRVEFLGNYDKVWAHRVDSAEKLKAATGFFDGVEVDLVYLSESQTLDVGHPPVPSINLSFESYIAAIPDGKQPHIWLDIKNLNNGNAQEILKRIIYILEKYKYPIDKLLIESQHPEGLALFSESGFLTSYYLPVGLNLKSDSELKPIISSIQNRLKKQSELGISSSYEDYGVLSKYFPERKKYLWKIDGLTFRNYSVTRKILKDSTVKVILSRFRSFKGNR